MVQSDFTFTFLVLSFWGGQFQSGRKVKVGPDYVTINPEKVDFFCHFLMQQNAYGIAVKVN